MTFLIWQTTKVLVCCCDWSSIINTPSTSKKPTKQNKTKKTHPSSNFKKYALLIFEYSSGFVFDFFTSSKYLITHFSHCRTAEAAISLGVRRVTITSILHDFSFLFSLNRVIRLQRKVVAPRLSLRKNF